MKGTSMRFRVLLLLAVCLALPTFAQELATANLTAAVSSCQPNTNPASCLFLLVNPQTNTVGATLVGTFSATLQFEGSANSGATWVSVQATPSSGASAVTSATAAGTWTIQAGGYSYLRIRCSRRTSGSATASLNPSQAVTPGTGGGGGSMTYPGAGGAVSSGSAWLTSQI